MIREKAGSKKMTFMEVCGTHTMAIARNGIRELLPDTITLISGPGCPVCVTPNRIVDTAIALSRMKNVTITTFGDMMKVPGSTSSLDHEHARGGDIRIVSSTLEALSTAEKNPDRKVIFLGVGFETTAPTIAASILEAKIRRLSNYSILCGHKVMPPAMRALSEGKVNIDGYICPGHVSTIIGSNPYVFIPAEYGIACVVAGFEPLDILQGIAMLVDQIQTGNPCVEIQYTRAVQPEGNQQAQEIIAQVFEPCDSNWRGIGIIPESGLRIRKSYSEWDAEIQNPVRIETTKEPKGCLCGQILQGLVRPPDCRLFAKQCTPENPVGPCMVSSEGTCAAYFKYNLPG
jgi:hydrogenase expression/formation protein HypD